MTIYILLSVLCILITGLSLGFAYHAWKVARSFDRKNRDDAKEIMKALRQAEEYTDGKGLISVQFVDRDRLIDVGVK